MSSFDFRRSAQGERGVSAPAPSLTPDLESNYGLDYDYVGLYDRDMKNHGKVMPETAELINKKIRSTNSSLCYQSTMFMASSVSAAYAEEQNQRVFDQEQINPSDGIPAYVERMLYHGPGKTAAEYNHDSMDMKSEFYNTVYYCDSVLSDRTKHVLGSEYKQYADYRRELSPKMTSQVQSSGNRRDYDAGIPVLSTDNDQFSL